MVPRTLELHPNTLKRLVRLSKEAEQDGSYRVAKRLRAVAMNAEGYSSGEIARILKAPRSKASEWLRAYEEHGVEALLEGHRSGRPSGLNEKQLRKLGDILDSGPAAYGLDTGIWTSPMIAWVIEEEFGIEYHPRHVRKILHDIGFVPPRDIRELRDLTRYRTKLLANGAAERNRIQKVLEDANIKLGSVLSDVFGVSGQKMLHALVDKPALNVEEVAALAHWRLQPKIEQLKLALEGRITAHHRFMVDLSMGHMQYIEQQILRLDEEIARHIAPYQQQFELLQTIPGIGETASASILSEIGPDMSPFDDDGKLASGSGICPGNNESAGKKFNTNTRKGNRHFVSTIVECAWASTRKKGSHFKARYYRVRARRGSQRAILAVGHGLVRTVFVVLKTGKPYQEPIRPLLTEKQRHRKAERLSRELGQLGFAVTLKPKTAQP